nr:response regulator [Thiorhodococcus minor]
MPETEGSARAPSSAAPKRVLIVDDHRDVADSLAALVSALGHEASCAYSGRHGLELARTCGADVVILDIGLPDMHGVELAASLLSACPDRRPRIIALSGHADQRTESGPSTAIEEWLTKPPDIAALEAAIAGKAA